MIAERVLGEVLGADGTLSPIVLVRLTDDEGVTEIIPEDDVVVRAGDTITWQWSE